jgi:hypothetical protein
MWPFKRKTRNRLHRAPEHVLDVKMRSDRARTARSRLAALVLGAVFALIAGGFVLWQAGVWALDRLVYQNPAFELRAVEISTDGIITIDQLRRWSGVKAGGNLMAIDLAHVKRELELIPAIESASVERVLPGTLRIRIIERLPVAQVNAPRPAPGGGVEMAAFQLDAEGVVIVPLEPRQRSMSAQQAGEHLLPLIYGIPGNELQPGRRIENAQVQSALKFLVAFEHSPMAGLVDLKRVDISTGDVLTAVTGQGSEVVLGLHDPERQLRRWREIFETGQKMNRTIATLDLAVSNNIPARWVEASLSQPVPRKIPKPLRNRKRNV